MDQNENFENVSEEVVETSVSPAIETTADDLHGENLNDRVRVLSPGMMVAKRFFRSKLSMLGLDICNFTNSFKCSFIARSTTCLVLNMVNSHVLCCIS